MVLEGKTAIRIEPNCQHAELPTSLLLTRAGHGEREGGLVNKKSIGTTGRDKAKAGKEKETGKGREWMGGKKRSESVFGKKWKAEVERTTLETHKQKKKKKKRRSG